MSAKDLKEPEYAVAMDEEEEEEDEENEYGIGRTGPRTPVDDAAAELNASLDISGSTEPSDGDEVEGELDCEGEADEGDVEGERNFEGEGYVEGEGDAVVEGNYEGETDRSHETSGTLEQCKTAAVQLVAEPAAEEESSSSSSSSSDDQSDSSDDLSDDDESKSSPNTVIDINDLTGNDDYSSGTTADNMESEEPVDYTTAPAVVDSEPDQMYEQMTPEMEMQMEAEVESLAVMEEEGETEINAEEEAPEEVPETPASPTDDGEEPLDLLPPNKRVRYAFDEPPQPERRMTHQQHQQHLLLLQQQRHEHQIQQAQLARMAPRDPRQRREAAYVMLDEFESISDSSDDGKTCNQAKTDDGNSSDEGSSSDDGSSTDDGNSSDDSVDDDDNDDVIIVEPDSTSRDTMTATETTDADGGLPTHKLDLDINGEKTYFIRRTDGTVHSGQVLQSRVTGNFISPHEFFVHYIGLNRRLDEWVERHRISDNAEDLGGITVTTPPEILSDQPSTSATALALAAASSLAATSASTSSSSGGSQPSISNIMRLKRQGRFKDYYMSACENNSYDYSDRKITRFQKRRYDEINHVQKSQEELSATEVALEKEHEQLTQIKHIEKLHFGNYEIDTWYYSPFPLEYRRVPVIYVCEYCLKYMRLEKSYRYHLYTCQRRSPPGREIYQKGTMSIFEVNGAEEKLYCQLLCLMAKLFLDHKALYYDMDPFYFYVLCETDQLGRHIVGYFSKEKKSDANHNVACILVLPPHQRKGYGKLLIAFSYELSRKEGVIGSPETPLSDLGRLSYRSYWAYTLLELMKGRCSPEQTSIKELSEASNITPGDIIYTLQSMKMIKYWKGQNVICVTAKMINDHLQLPQFKRPKLTIDPNYLNWKPHTPPPPPLMEVPRNTRLQ